MFSLPSYSLIYDILVQKLYLSLKNLLFYHALSCSKYTDSILFEKDQLCSTAHSSSPRWFRLTLIKIKRYSELLVRHEPFQGMHGGKNNSPMDPWNIEQSLRDTADNMADSCAHTTVPGSIIHLYCNQPTTWHTLSITNSNKVGIYAHNYCRRFVQGCRHSFFLQPLSFDPNC